MSRYAVLAAASVFALVTSAHAVTTTTLYSTDFEDFDTNSSLTDYGFGVDGGTATVVAGPNLAHSGVQAAQLSVGANAAFTYQLTPVTDLSTQPIIQAQASMLIASPATGNANRGVLASFALYDSNVDEIADMTIFYDAENTFGSGANHVYLQGSFYADPTATVDGFAYDLGAFTSSQLTTTLGYFNLGMSLDYSTGSVGFYESGEYIGNGVFDPAAFGDFSDADLITARLTDTKAGTLPRILADDYIIEQTDTLTLPEPTTLLASAGLLAGVAPRRRRQA